MRSKLSNCNFFTESLLVISYKNETYIYNIYKYIYIKYIYINIFMNKSIYLGLAKLDLINRHVLVIVGLCLTEIMGKRKTMLYRCR